MKNKIWLSKLLAGLMLLPSLGLDKGSNSAAQAWWPFSMTGKDASIFFNSLPHPWDHDELEKIAKKNSDLKKALDSFKVVTKVRGLADSFTEIQWESKCQTDKSQTLFHSYLLFIAIYKPEVLKLMEKYPDTFYSWVTSQFFRIPLVGKDPNAKMIQQLTVMLSVIGTIPVFSLIAMNFARAIDDNFIYSRNKLSMGNRTLALLFETLSNALFGQDEAIQQLVSYLSGKSGTKLIVLAGPPGTGKTQTVQILNKICFSSDSLSPYQHICGSDFRSFGDDKIIPFICAQKSNMIKQLTHNPNLLIFFDEIDKCSGNALSVFQNVIDTELLPVYVKEQRRSMDNATKIDTETMSHISVHDTMFVLACNESPEGLGQTGNLTAKMVTDGIAEDESEALRIFKSWPWSKRKAALREVYGNIYNYIERDSSALSRMCVINFNPLSETSLAQIIEKQFKELTREMNLNLTISKNDLAKLAKEAFSSQRGARAAQEICSKLTGKFSLFSNFGKKFPASRKFSVVVGSNSNDCSFKTVS